MLNLDAARAVRCGRRDLARELAARGEEVERSSATARVRELVSALISAVPRDPDGAPPSDRSAQALRHYLHMRSAATGRYDDRGEHTRAWLARASTWADVVDSGELEAALAELTRLTAQARHDVGEEWLPAVTFLGIVRRLDDVAAELESGSGERWAVGRRDLEREGLAQIGQAVAIVREELPRGPIILLYASATRLGRDRRFDDRVFDPFHGDDETEVEYSVEAADVIWLDRLLVRDPAVLPAAPIRIEDD